MSYLQLHLQQLHDDAPHDQNASLLSVRRFVVVLHAVMCVVVLVRMCHAGEISCWYHTAKTDHMHKQKLKNAGNELQSRGGNTLTMRCNELC
jgi:hypothetical protein